MAPRDPILTRAWVRVGAPEVRGRGVEVLGRGVGAEMRREVAERSRRGCSPGSPPAGVWRGKELGRAHTLNIDTRPSQPDQLRLTTTSPK